MSTFLKIYCTSALSLLLGTTAGFADVKTPTFGRAGKAT